MPPRAAYRASKRPVQREGFFERLLDPIDRLSETIFSVLILLTFTLAYRLIRLGPDPYAPIPPEYLVELFFAALGATVTWGFIDGVIYALLSVFGRGEKHRFLANIQAAGSEEEGVQAIADELDYVLEPITGEQQRRLLYADVLDHLRDSKPQPVRLTRADLYGGMGCVLVAVLAVLPSLLPLLLLREDYALALRASNLISFGVLFYTGYEWGKYSGLHPWKTGLLLAALGAALAALAIPLGG
jgi:VIT1/CCC1 family predicted Fe2+/Mn2+ transporter